MKKTVSLLLAAVMLLSLCACGAGAKYDSATTEAYYEPMEEEYIGFDAAEESAAYAEMNGYAVGAAAGYSGDSAASANRSAGSDSGSFDSEKIIYSGNAEIETQDFDACCESIRRLIDECGGFLESSSVHGEDHYLNGCRYAEYVIRLPREDFERVTEELSSLGNVLYCNVNAQNISAQYRDTESRLSTYRTEEERLLAMLAKCETVEDMLNIEDRLADVRYNIESLTTTLRGWDGLVSYSTLTLSVSEVKEYTPEPEEGYWQNIGRRFVNTLKGVGEAVAEAFAFVIAALPVIVILGGIAVGVVAIVRRGKKRRVAKENRE